MSNVSLIDGHIDYDKMTPQKALEMLNDVKFSEKYQGKQKYTDMLLFCKEALEKLGYSQIDPSCVVMTPKLFKR